MRYQMFKSLGEYIVRDNGTSVKGMSDVELLKFYMALVNDGSLKIGSSGWMRMCTIKDRVKKRERSIKRGADEHGTNLKALQKSVNFRSYVGGLITDVDKAIKNSLTTQ